MPVDFGGQCCDYDQLNALVIKYKNIFLANTLEQKTLNRILVLSDSAHSFGAWYNGKRAGSLTDVSVFSFHAVKNLTTAEGGAVALNLPEPFDNENIYKSLCVKTLHGQDKDALAKTIKGNWRYDIVEAGYKCNMTDIMAAIGLIELERYDKDTLKVRQNIFEQYDTAFSQYSWAQLPEHKTLIKTSSYHLYALRIKNITEAQRDAIMKEIYDFDVSVNVHFIPVPMMSFYKNMGYDINNYPITFDNYSREISLPVFFDLNDDLIKTIVNAVTASVKKVLG